MAESAMWLMKFKASKVVAAAALGVPFTVTIGPVVGTALVAALGVVCVAGFLVTTRRRPPQYLALSIPPA